MTPRKRPPCTKECPKRDEYCHGTCKEYSDWCNENEEYKKKVREIKQCEGDMMALVVKRAIRTRQAAERVKKLGGSGNGEKSN